MADDDEVFELFGRWFWVSAGCLVVGIIALTLLWYAKHPDRSPFAEWTPPGPMGAPSSNGHLPAQAPAAHDEVVGSTEEG